MFLAIAAVLLVLWALGVVAFHVTAFAIHVLLVVAVVALLWHFMSAGSRRSRV
ncbi:MAG: lmo0937 family membrane protein [Actinomycetota bacterium]|nr:lmo0937 family membrane protein [Actinomycetota bacterium]